MPRIAFFPDSFHEVNGVAHTARNFVSFARWRQIPMLCIRAGGLEGKLIRDGSVEILQLDRGHWAVRMEEDLSFDPFFVRHGQAIGKALRKFRPDVIHITGPSELGLFGAGFAWRMGVPLAASWHTNVHEYAGRRLAHSTERLGQWSTRLGRVAEDASLSVAARLYRRAAVVYAPNPGLCDLLQARTEQPCHLMQRGVDTCLFSPERRTPGEDEGFSSGLSGGCRWKRTLRCCRRSIAICARVVSTRDGRWWAMAPRSGASASSLGRPRRSPACCTARRLRRPTRIWIF